MAGCSALSSSKEDRHFTTLLAVNETVIIAAWSRNLVYLKLSNITSILNPISLLYNALNSSMHVGIYMNKVHAAFVLNYIFVSF